MLWRQGQTLRNGAAVRNPDNALFPDKQLHGGLDRSGQLCHGKQADRAAPGKAQQFRAFQPSFKILRFLLRKLQHDVNGLQKEGVRVCSRQPDKFAVKTDIPHPRPELAQHGIHAALGYLQIGTAEFLPCQRIKLPAANTAQLSQDLQDVFLLNG